MTHRTASWNTPYTFSGKEKDVETGYSYFGARYYDSDLSIWLSVDPISDKYPSMSPYNYCANNPVILVDPDGREINISGKAQQEYFNQLKIGAKAYGIKVKMDKNGNLSAKYKGKGPISEDGQKIMDAINDKTVHVKINAKNRTEEDLMFGGTFGGNDIKGGVTTDGVFSSMSTDAYQTVIPSDLKAMDDFYGKKGQTSLHEMTEAYMGAKIAEKNGYSSTETGGNNPFYNQSHNAAIPQSGPVNVFYYDRNDQRLNSSADFNNVRYIDWNVGCGTNNEKNLKTSIINR